MLKCAKYKRFVLELKHVLNKFGCVNKNVIFVCVGNGSVVGDSFGPWVGSILTGKSCVDVVGNLENNINYENIEFEMSKVEKLYSDRIVVVVDSALASMENNVGKIFIENRGLKYGEALDKKNRTIGDISIKAAVGRKTDDSLLNFQVLRNASLRKVKGMSKIVAYGIVEALNSNV